MLYYKNKIIIISKAKIKDFSCQNESYSYLLYIFKYKKSNLSKAQKDKIQ